MTSTTITLKTADFLTEKQLNQLRVSNQWDSFFELTTFFDKTAFGQTLIDVLQADDNDNNNNNVNRSPKFDQQRYQELSSSISMFVRLFVMLLPR
jgi:hypothetical protein